MGLLLSHGAEVDVGDVKQMTPLHCASQNGQTDAARALLSAGASVNSLDEHLLTPLHYACQNGHVDVA